MLWTLALEEAPINPNKWFNNKLSQYYKLQFFSLVTIPQEVVPHQGVPTIDSIFST